MNSKLFRLMGVMGILVLAALASTAIAEETSVEGKKPIGWMNMRGGPLKPLYGDEVREEVKSFSEDANKLAERVEAVKIDPNAPKDEIEKQFNGAMSLSRHQADINALRDRFVECMTAMESNLQVLKDEGKMTAEAQKQFDECQAHCDNVMKIMDSLHKNTSSLRTATRQQYFLNAWDKHKKLVTQLRTEASSCPSMFDTMIKATGTPAKGPGGESMHEGHEGKDLSGMFDKDSCCDKAHQTGKTCEHPCCKEAADAGKVCMKCNPGAAGKI